MNELRFRAAFWVLIGLLLVIRGVSSWGVRWAGELLLPDPLAVGALLSAPPARGVRSGRAVADPS